MQIITTLGEMAQAAPLQNAKTQRATILRLLMEACGRWLPSPEIAAFAQQYNARLSELRWLGFRNRTESAPETGVRRSWFRLVISASSKLPESPKPRSHPASNHAQLTGLRLFDLAVSL